MSELMWKPAGELGALVRSGELSAAELVEVALAAIEQLQPRVNAFTHVAGDSARSQARAIRPGDTRPFAGVPIAIKDNRAVAGMPLTMCSQLFGDFVPQHDAYVIRRLRCAGFVIVGKTALPEMGILPTTESRRFGPARNPWDPDRTPGGSSGGSAAAVAAGMVPLAHGNDGGGSTRIPAACCGLVGLKTARGRVSTGPDSGHSYLGGDGVLTRTVAESAALLDVLAGYEPGDATWAPPPREPFAAAAQHRPAGLRIGLILEPPLPDARLDPECERATREAAALLESLGHHMSELRAPWPQGELLADFTRAFAPHVSMAVLAGSRIRGRDATPEDVEPLSWEIWEHARTQSTMQFLAAQTRLEQVARDLVRRFAGFDAILTPALARRPVPIGEIHGCGEQPWEQYSRSAGFTPYTAIVNVTGLPAISLPLYQGDDGLPTAVQLIGTAAGEGRLLALAAQLETACPWAGRRPVLGG